MKHFFEKGYKVLLVTDNRGNNFVKNYPNFKTYILKAGTPTRKNFLNKFLSFLVIFHSIIKSIIILKREKPDLVFGFGGYVSFPISFASKFFNLPLVLYENNTILGRANKYLAFFSKKILISKKISINFPEKIKNKVREVGAILDKKIISYTKNKVNNIRENFSILVLGGSQGAEIFGIIVPPVIKMIKKEGYEVEIIQQCIMSQRNSIEDYYKKNNIKNYIFEFEKDVLKLISSSNLVITRSGASTTAELTQTLTPFIAVPLPDSIDNHQYLNAKYYETRGCCLLLEQRNFNTNNLFNLIMQTIKNKNKLENIKKNMEKNCNNNVYENIEYEITKII